jgi:repressor LexA
MPISPKQQRVYDFIRRYMQSNGEAPTITEICAVLHMRSTASVHAVLAILEREGLIKKVPNVSRGIVLTGEPSTAGVILHETSELVN